MEVLKSASATIYLFHWKSDLSRERSEQRTERFAVDEKIDAVVSQFDKKTRNLTLSIKAREIAEEKRAMADYGSSDSGASLGDILGAALAKEDGSILIGQLNQLPAIYQSDSVGVSRVANVLWGTFYERTDR